MCRYKPLLLVVHIHAVTLLFFIMFTLSIYMYFGGFYPAKRFQVTWIWSMIHYMSSFMLVVLIEMLMYKELLNRVLNQTCLGLTLVAAISGGMLSAVIWPPISQTEFTTFMIKQFDEDREIPAFLEWLQFKQGCCGINNYRDYIFIVPPVKTYEEYHHDIPLNFSRLSSRVLNARRLKDITFSVPRSCCNLKTRVDRSCGDEIKYNDPKEIKLRINDVQQGCYQTFYNMISNDAPTQVVNLFNIYKTYPLIDAILHLLTAMVHGFYFDRSLKNLHAREYQNSGSA